jgi:NTE family protein
VHWVIGGSVDEYMVGNPLGFGTEATAKVAQVPTRLTRFPAEAQNLVMQAGYAQADAALRASGLSGLIEAKPSV